MSSTDEILAQRLADGDQSALAELFDRYRDRLRKMVDMRLDPRLQGRVDASDVVQDVYLAAQRRLGEFAETDLPLLLWFRLLASQRMVDLQRFHLRSQKRTANREVSINRSGTAVQCDSMVRQLVGKLTTASGAAVRSERAQRIHKALQELQPIDQEVLSLRHFEGLTNAETARALDISIRAASNRYVRALRHLREVFQ